MSLIIADSSLLTYALYNAFENKDEFARVNWICNRIAENIQHVDHATLLHLRKIIDDKLDPDWNYMQSSSFNKLQDTIVEQLKVYA